MDLVEDVPPLANVGALQTDAQAVVVNFTRDMPAIGQLQSYHKSTITTRHM